MITREGTTLVANAWHAESWWSRLRGLLFRPPLQADGSEGLLITPCGSVHTCGMTYPIDIVFIDDGGVVVGCREAVVPLRFRMQRGSRSVLELAQGAIRRHRIRNGDLLSWTPGPEGVPG